MSPGSRSEPIRDRKGHTIPMARINKPSPMNSAFCVHLRQCRPSGDLEQWRLFRLICWRRVATIGFVLDLTWLRSVCAPRRPFEGASGAPLPHHAAASRSSVTRRRILWARFCRPILAFARTMQPRPTVRRRKAQSPETWRAIREFWQSLPWNWRSVPMAGRRTHSTRFPDDLASLLVGGDESAGVACDRDHEIATTRHRGYGRVRKATENTAKLGKHDRWQMSPQPSRLSY
jgi:hypothetical protein